jgi:hypothetical protein
LTESKETLAANIFSAFDRKMRDLLLEVLKNGGIERGEAVDMFFAAAIGTLRIGESAARPYRARLTALTDILVAGLKHRVPQQAIQSALISYWQSNSSH